MAAIMDMPISSIFSFISHAIEKEQENAAWDMWNSLYPFMMIGWIPFKPFDKFKNELIRPEAKHSNKTLEEIEKEMMEVVNAYEKRK